jgi:hypothetical protein
MEKRHKDFVQALVDKHGSEILLKLHNYDYANIDLSVGEQSLICMHVSCMLIMAIFSQEYVDILRINPHLSEEYKKEYFKNLFDNITRCIPDRDKFIKDLNIDVSKSEDTTININTFH